MWVSAIRATFGHRGGKFVGFREVMLHDDETDALRRANSMPDTRAVDVAPDETLDEAWARNFPTSP